MQDQLSTDVLTYEATNTIGIIRFNRPNVHNALNESSIEALEAVLERAETDPQIRALIVTGTGSQTFCAGGDLQYFSTLGTREKGLAMSRTMQAILDRLWSGSKPVIAAINGRAVGGGCEILTACHFRIAARTATFEYRQAENGLITGWGGGARLFHLLGRTNALNLLLTGDRIDATQALQIGLLDQVEEPERLQAVALEFAEKVSKHSPAVVAAILELARLHYSCDINKAIERETELFGDRWISDEFQNAINNFKTHRLTRGKKEGDEL